MPAAARAESSRTHPKGSPIVSLFTGWAQQGVQTFFATQRILLDLAMRQNAAIMHTVRQQLTDPHHSPASLLSEAAGEGITHFIEGQKVLLDLGKKQNEILMGGVKERIGDWPAAHAMADLLRRSVDTFIHMQEEFLKITDKQTHTWVEAAKGGKQYRGDELMELARDSMENFIKAQKQFMDIVAEETAKATGAKPTNGARKLKKTEFADLARQATESFIEAQKRFVDLTGKQMNANVKTAGKAMESMKPFPFLPLAELTREGVKSYVEAQKALMDAMVRPMIEHKQPVKPVRHAKKGVRVPKAVGATA